ncbi:MAG: glycosyltransferase [Chitinivibrionales bacterium]|nr:glycosyltransferase [Chitinivibrionales bacterium]
MPRVSVVMPAFNSAATIAQAIDSILAQSLQDFECIIVDDGSADATGTIIEAYRADNRIIVLRQEHAGIVAALCAGLAVARSPLIARMDADDISLPCRLLLQAEFFAKHVETGLVASKVWLLSTGLNNRGHQSYVDWTNSLLEHDDIFRNRFVESPFAHPSVMFRRSLLEQFGGYRDGAFPEDYDLWLKWLEAGVVMRKLPEALLHWRDHPQRLSRQGGRYSIEAFYRCKAHYLVRWIKAYVNRPVYLWGAGRITRKRARYLQENGMTLAGYIDVDKRKIDTSSLPVIYYQDLPARERAFVLVYVGNRGARARIKAYLNMHEYREGIDFYCCA